MAASKLDQIVKGAAPPSVSVPDVKSREPSLEPESNDAANEMDPNDPTTMLPSSPPQIYLNLLILEASLRSQYLTLRARRRQNTFFLVLLALWNAFFAYALFLRPREDGRGLGGSVYWVVETTEKVALMGGVVTALLIWGTGQWERGVRWPRRFVAVTNRGLRTMNCKIVLTRGPWWREAIGKLACLLPFSAYYVSHGSSYHYIETMSEKRPHHHGSHVQYQEEDLASGGDGIKLLLLPKPFSPDFRENWELYRTEYWERENARRATLRQQLKTQQRQQARQHGDWFWWLLGLRRNPILRTPVLADVEKTHLHASHHASHASRSHLEKDPTKKHVVGLRHSEASHSRNTSRSSTPASVDGDNDGRPPSRGSTRGAASTEGRKKQRGTSAGGSKKGSRLSGPALERSAPMPMSMATQTRSASGLTTSSQDSDGRE